MNRKEKPPLQVFLPGPYKFVLWWLSNDILQAKAVGDGTSGITAKDGLYGECVRSTGREGLDYLVLPTLVHPHSTESRFTERCDGVGLHC